MNDQTIRQQVERHLGSPLREGEWTFLKEYEFVSELLDGASTVEDLANEVRRLFRTAQPHRAPRRTWGTGASGAGEPQPTRRERMLADVFAAEARQIDEVQAYREAIVSQDGTGHDLLTWDEVLNWLEVRAAEERPIGLWLTGAFLPEEARDFMNDALAEDYDAFPHDALGNLEPLPVTVTIDPTNLVDYLVVRRLRCLVRNPETGRVFVYDTSTREYGELAWLRALGADLAQRFTWKAPEAVRFVLTDMVPRVRTISVRAHVNIEEPTSTRMTLSIDPALSPRAVADAYRHARRNFLRARHRELSEKHAQLAAFAAVWPAGETWAQRMSRWNARYPQWKYDQPTNFARDCTQAVRRVLRPAYLPSPPDDIATPHS